MADNIDIETLRKGIDLLNKAVGGRGAASSASGAYNSYKKDGDGIDFDKVRNIVKNNGDVAQQMLAVLKDASKSSSKLEGLMTSLEKSSRDMNDTQRKAVLALGDFITGVVKQGKSATDALEDITNALEETAKNITAFDSLVSNVEVNNAGLQKAFSERKKIEDAFNTLRADQDARLAKAIKNKKSTKSIRSEIDEAQKKHNDSMADIMADIADIQKKYNDATDAVDKATDSFLFMDKVTKSLSKDQLDMIQKFKNGYKTMDKDQRNASLQAIKASGAFDNLKDGMEGLSKGTKEAADVVVKNSDKLGKSLKSAGEFALKFGKALLTMIPALTGDMFARHRYNVDSTDYTGNISRGLSEKQRAEIIGTNRNQLRAQGGGDENKGYSNTLEIQRTAHLFGVTGAEAIKKALEYQNISAGFGGSFSDPTVAKQQIAQMREMAKQIGVTDDELKDFYNTLKDNGELAALSQKYADKSDIERGKAINREIYERTRLNTALGISVDMQKQLQQEAVNKRYSGIESLIKTQIGSGIQVSQYNKANPNSQISKADSDFYARVTAAGGIDTLTNDADRTKYGNISQRMASSDLGRLKSAQEKAANGDSSSMFGEALNTQLQSAFGLDRQGFDTNWGKAAQQRQAQGENAVGKGSFNDILKSASENLDGPQGFTKAVYDATEALHGLGHSPAGGLLKLVGGTIAQWLGGKLLSKGAGYLAGKVGADGLAGRVLGSLSGEGGSILGSLKNVGGAVGKAASGAEGLFSKGGSIWGALKNTGGELISSNKGALLRGGAGLLASLGIDRFLGDSSTLSEGNTDLASKALRGGDHAANWAMASGWKPAQAVGLTYKLASRAGAAAQRQLAKSNTFNDASDLLFGSTFGGLNALFTGDKSGWNQGMAGGKALIGDIFGKSAPTVNPTNNAVNVPNYVPDPMGLSTKAPSQIVGAMVENQTRQTENDQNMTKLLKAVENISKTNTAMNDRDEKTAQTDAQKDANIGSVYSEYSQHLEQSFGGVSHRAPA